MRKKKKTKQKVTCKTRSTKPEPESKVQYYYNMSTLDWEFNRYPEGCDLFL